MNEIYPKSSYSIQLEAQLKEADMQDAALVKDDILERPFVPFKDWLWQLQQERGLNGRKLAKLAGISHTVIYRIYSGESIPFTSTALKVSKGLEIGTNGFYDMLRNTIPLDKRYELTQRYARRSQAVRDEGFGEQIRIYRKDIDNKFSQRRLAAEAEIDHSHLSRIEAGVRTEFRLDSFARLAHALALSPAQTYNLAESAV